MSKIQESINKLNDKQFACLALFSDDPYGDGIRLDKVREPSKYREIILDFWDSGQLPLWGFEEAREHYNEQIRKCFTVTGSFKQEVVINCLKNNKDLFKEYLVKKDSETKKKEFEILDLLTDKLVDLVAFMEENKLKADLEKDAEDELLELYRNKLSELITFMEGNKIESCIKAAADLQ